MRMPKLPLTGPGPDPSNPDRPVYTPPGGPPANTSVSKEIFGHMGEDNVRAMISDFYDRLIRSPIANLFPSTPEGLVEAKDRSASFFIFLLGGPPLYQQTYGPPMMRARHMPFRIDQAARAAWLAEFNAVLDDAPAKYAFPEQHLPGFRAFLDSFSGWMVNAEG